MVGNFRQREGIVIEWGQGKGVPGGLSSFIDLGGRYMGVFTWLEFIKICAVFHITHIAILHVCMLCKLYTNNKVLLKTGTEELSRVSAE